MSRFLFLFFFNENKCNLLHESYYYLLIRVVELISNCEYSAQII
jgi:hypothetical protein